MFLQEFKGSLSESSILLGAYHKGANHWCLVMFNIAERFVAFLDPKGNIEAQIASGICYNWTAYSRAWNRTTPHKKFPNEYRVNVIPHALQPTNDNSNCGIYTLVFAKRYLRSESLKNVDVALEGALIAAEIMDHSTMDKHCSKCGVQIKFDEPFRACHKAVCEPRRWFHVRCIPEKFRKKTHYTCEICDPANRQYLCQDVKCNGPADDTIQTCSYGCQRFVHFKCLPNGMSTYSCGVCPYV